MENIVNYHLRKFIFLFLAYSIIRLQSSKGDWGGGGRVEGGGQGEGLQKSGM